MTQLLSTLNGIWEFLKTLAFAIDQFFASLTAIIQNIPGTLSFLTGSIVALPTFVSAFATLTLALTIAYFLIGRNPGGSD